MSNIDFPPDRLPPQIAAELAFLRERLQVQHSLVHLYERMAAAGTVARKIDVHDMIPARSWTQSRPASGGTLAKEAVDLGALEAASGMAGWTTARAPEESLRGNVGWALYGLTGRVSTMVGFSVCGTDPRGVVAAIELVVATQSRQRNFIPLFLTDQNDLTPFRERGYTVEYLAGPPPTDGSAQARWQWYARRRRELIVAKWNLSRIVDLGPIPFGELSPVELKEITSGSLSDTLDPLAQRDLPLIPST